MAGTSLTPPRLPWNTSRTMADDAEFWNKHPDDNGSRAQKETKNEFREKHPIGRDVGKGEGR